MHAGLDLARRLEAGEALNGVACVEALRRISPEMEPMALEVAGGFAIFAGAGSPLTQAVGLGMRGGMRADEMDRMEEFYGARDAAVSVDLCPLADSSVVDLLGERGYRVSQFNNVLVRVLPGAECAPARDVRLAQADEEQVWAQTVGRGFLEKDELSSDELQVGLTVWNMAGARAYFAFQGDVAAAAGAMATYGGLATMFADSTLAAFRGKGLQAALIQERLRAAVDAGCDLSSALTLPGSISQRNYERNGFRVAYTKATLVRPVER